MHENRIYFDIEDANALVPTLEYMFADITRIGNQLASTHSRAIELGFEIDVEKVREEGTSDSPLKKRHLEEKLITLTEEYAQRLEDIYDLGVVIEDLDLGIVNFYSWVDGMEVFLSWQYGEREVRHWHAIHENCVERKALSKLVTHAPEEEPLH